MNQSKIQNHQSSTPTTPFSSASSSSASNSFEFKPTSTTTAMTSTPNETRVACKTKASEDEETSQVENHFVHKKFKRDELVSKPATTAAVAATDETKTKKRQGFNIESLLSEKTTEKREETPAAPPPMSNGLPGQELVNFLQQYFWQQLQHSNPLLIQQQQQQLQQQQHQLLQQQMHQHQQRPRIAAMPSTSIQYAPSALNPMFLINQQQQQQYQAPHNQMSYLQKLHQMQAAKQLFRHN